MLIIDVNDDNRTNNWSAAEMTEEINHLRQALNQKAQQATKSLKASRWRTWSYFDRSYDDDELDRFYWNRESYATDLR